MKRIQTILKRKTIERKDSIKLHWYQGKDVRSLSKVILTPLKEKKKEKRKQQFLRRCLMWTCYVIHKEYFIKLKDRGQDLIGIFSWTNLPLKKD